MKIESGQIIHDLFAGQEIIVIGQRDGDSVSLFSAKTNGRVNGYDVQLIQNIEADGVTIDAKMNANYFVMSNGMALGVRCGYDEWSVPRQDAWLFYALKRNGETEIGADSDFWYTQSEVVFACSPAMILLFRGDTYNLKSPAAGTSKNGANTQSMLLRTKDRFALAVCKGRLTPDQCRQWARSIDGICDLILMDSGGSTCLEADGKMLMSTTRKISNCIGFYHKKQAELPDTEVKAMNGIDISNWQKDIDLRKLNYDFMIAKATEGTLYVDPYCDGFIQTAKSMGKLWGFYHFARPTNDAIREADFFVNNTRNYFGEGIPVLDWEAENKNDVQWALRWLNRVRELTGVKPLIYMSESVVNAYDWSSVVAGDYGLWVAKYRDTAPDYNYDMSSAGKAPKVKWWAGYAMWQWTSVGKLEGYSGSLDCDVFYGDKDAWKAYARSINADTPDKDDSKENTELEDMKQKIAELENTVSILKEQIKKAIKALEGEE